MAAFAAQGIQDIADVGHNLANFRFANKQAKKQREFQERMFKNRFRYTMTDMRAAGLNPILAAGMGLGGGGSPSGAKGQQGGMVARPSPVGSATQALQLDKQLRLMDRQAENLRADSYLKHQQENTTAIQGLVARHTADGQLIQNKLNASELSRKDIRDKIYKTPYVGTALQGLREAMGANRGSGN